MVDAATLFGIASAATVTVAAFSLRERQAKTVAGAILLTGWAIANMTGYGHNIFWPVMDALLGALFLMAWIERPSHWKIELFTLFVAQTVCHSGHHIALALGFDFGYGYVAALNALFLCQLWVIASDGAERGWNIMRDRINAVSGGTWTDRAGVSTRQER